MPAIKGEYWIADGDLLFADGDIADIDHCGFVVDRARRNILDQIGCDAPECDFLDDFSFREALEDFSAESDLPWNSSSPEECLAEWHRDHDVEFNANLIPVAHGAGDLREFAMKEWGWKWVRGNHVATHHLTKDDAVAISRGICDVLEAEGEIDDTGNSFDVEIAVGSTGKRYTISSSDLIDENFEDLLPGQIEMHAPCDQVTRMDRDILSPTYRGRPFGD